MMRSSRARSGYTLMELLVYAVVLAVIVNLCAALFFSARRVYALGELSITRMDALRDIETDFRKAAARSTEITGDVDGLTTPNILLALRGDTKDGVTPFALWRMGESRALIFETYERRNGELDITRQHGYAIEVTEATATALGESDGVVRLQIMVDNKGTPNTIPLVNTFVARLGGGAP